MADVYSVRIYAPTPERPCVVCAGYPEGWAGGVVYRGEISLCSDHRDRLQGVIEEREAWRS